MKWTGSNLVTHFLAKMVDTTSLVETWVANGGPAMIFLLLFACGLGLPLPEDIPLLAGGFFAGRGQMNLIVVCILAWLGIVGGDCVLYRFGWKYGLNITRVPFVGKHVTKERILRAEKLFDRWGIWVVAIGRLFAGIRGAMVVAAGATRFSFVKFVIADGLAALVSGGLFIWAGHWLGSQFRDKTFSEVVEMVKPYAEYIVGGLLLLVILFIGYRWLRYRKGKAVTDVAIETAVTVAEKAQPPTTPGPVVE